MVDKLAIPSPLLAFRYRVGIQMQMGPRWRQKPGTGQWSLQGAKGEGSRNGGDLWPGHLSPHSTKYATAEKPTRRHSVRKRQAQRWSQVVWPHMPASGQGSKSYQFQPNRARIQPRGQANWIGSQEGIHVFNADSKLSDGQGHLCGAWLLRSCRACRSPRNNHLSGWSTAPDPCRRVRFPAYSARYRISA